MDSLAALKAEIAKKRNATTANLYPASAGPPKRWRTKKEIDDEQQKAYYALERQEEQRRAQEKSRRTAANAPIPAHPTTPASASHPSHDKAGHTSEADGQGVAAGDTCVGEPPLCKAEVIVRLRALKEPATLFGESAWQRFNRMRELELAREESSKGQRNVFQAKMREMEAKDAEDDMLHYTGAKLPQIEDARKGAGDKSHLHRDDEEQAPTCKEDYVYSQLRKYMRLWGSEIESMSKEERRTNKGRSLAVTHEQTKDWLKPLYKLLRKRKLPKNILDALNNIFEAAAEREYVRANGLYLEQLAIGKAPWPMGATMVGIHARAAREKIGEDKIAHVMNDERTRKYIQAVKRLLTVAQRHYPTSFSKMIM
eukprot:GFKZ01011918.1.p1 GENE.GFKZ01011918.1~~GFKZ01011918.1.p1  ORF type:complete len:369 (-),score=69.36 GFKZ01011918.1:1258-2364(-)